jgi:hypothetical protein
MFTSGKLMALEELKSSCAMAARAAPAQVIRMWGNTSSSADNLRELQACRSTVKAILLEKPRIFTSPCFSALRFHLLDGIRH